MYTNEHEDASTLFKKNVNNCIVFFYLFIYFFWHDRELS